MSAPPTFREVQAQFAAHLRAPLHSPPPADVDPSRAAVYARLLFNNLNALMSNCFPVLRAVTDDDSWHALLRGFYADHRARTPLFPRLPQEFAGWLAHTQAAADRAPFVAELADYEWLELECAQDVRELSDTVIDPLADLMDDIPVLNPLARLRTYRFPVHTIAPGRLPVAASAEPTWLVVLRGRDDKVAYLQLNAVSARLVELVADNTQHSGRALLLRIAGELAHPRPDRLLEAGQAILADLKTRELLLGAVRGAR